MAEWDRSVYVWEVIKQADYIWSKGNMVKNVITGVIKGKRADRSCCL